MRQVPFEQDTRIADRVWLYQRGPTQMNQQVNSPPLSGNISPTASEKTDCWGLRNGASCLPVGRQGLYRKSSKTVPTTAIGLLVSEGRWFFSTHISSPTRHPSSTCSKTERGWTSGTAWSVCAQPSKRQSNLFWRIS